MQQTTTSRLALLTALMRDKTINRIELAELEDLLQDESNMEEYIEISAMDSILAASFDNGGADTMEHLFPHPSQITTPKKSHSPWLWGGIAAAATFCISGVWILKEAADHKRPSVHAPLADAAADTTADTTKSPHAAITKSSVGLSSADHQLYGNGTLLKNIPHRLTSGILEVTTSNGSKLIVEAPASFTMKEKNSIDIDYGRFYVDGYAKFESISVYYGKGYHIRAGKEFAITVSTQKNSATQAEISSFRGKTVIQSPVSKAPITVSESESIQCLADGQTQTIPFNGSHYFRDLPQRDLVWTTTYSKNEKLAWISPNDPRYTGIEVFNNHNGQPDNLRYGISQTKTINLDVSGLVWRPGNYQAVLKWVSGMDAMLIDKVQLFLDGDLISEDIHPGKTGDTSNTYNHMYHLSIPPEKFKRGNWQILATVRGALRNDGTLPESTKGVLYFGNEVSHNATENDYIGDWEYHFNGRTFTRRLKPNGRVGLYAEGKELPAHAGQWSVKNNILHILFDNSPVLELHMLRDKHTLLFLNRPYNNAVKIRQNFGENQDSNPAPVNE